MINETLVKYLKAYFLSFFFWKMTKGNQVRENGTTFTLLSSWEEEKLAVEADEDARMQNHIRSMREWNKKKVIYDRFKTIINCIGHC